MRAVPVHARTGVGRRHERARLRVVLVNRSRDAEAAGTRELPPPILEPVPKCARALDVVTVVPLDALEMVGGRAVALVQLEPALELDNAA